MYTALKLILLSNKPNIWLLFDPAQFKLGRYCLVIVPNTIIELHYIYILISQGLDSVKENAQYFKLYLMQFIHLL